MDFKTVEQLDAELKALDAELVSILAIAASAEASGNSQPLTLRLRQTLERVTQLDGQRGKIEARQRALTEYAALLRRRRQNEVIAATLERFRQNQVAAFVERVERAVRDADTAGAPGALNAVHRALVENYGVSTAVLNQLTGQVRAEVDSQYAEVKS